MLLDLDNDVLFKVLAFLIPCDLVGIFAFASVCETAWEETCNWLRTFQVLRIESMPITRTLPDLFWLAGCVRRELDETLDDIWVGNSSFSFRRERTACNKCMHLEFEPTELAQRLLPFFEVGNSWNYSSSGCGTGILSAGRVCDFNLGDVGICSVVLALRHMGHSVTHLDLGATSMTDVGVRYLAALLKTSLPALTYLDLAHNDITRYGKSTITKALKCLPRATPRETIVSYGSRN